MWRFFVPVCFQKANSMNKNQLDGLFDICRFNGKKDTRPKAQSLSWAALVECLVTHDLRAEKDGELWSPVRYGCGKTRKAENVEAVSALVLDFDSGANPKDVSRPWELAELAFVLHTTHSHSLESPKWRAVFPLQNPVDADEWARVYPKLAAHLGGNAWDQSCKDASRIYYLPACPPDRSEEAFAFALPGAALDVESIPDIEEESASFPNSLAPLPAADVNSDKARKYVLSALTKEREKMLGAGAGERHDQRYRSAMALGGYVPLLSESEITEALSVNFGQDKKAALETIADGIKNGKAKPRTLPQSVLNGFPNGHSDGAAPRPLPAPIRSQTATPHTAPIPSNPIPTPTLKNERGALEYESGQLVKVLRPGWDCAALSTHAAHATRIFEHTGADLRFSSNLGWLTFDGRQWQRDDRHATQTADRVKTLSQVVRAEGAELYELAGTLARDGRSSDAEALGRAAMAHTRHAKQVEAKSFVEGALHFAAGNPQIRVSPDVFDQRAWLLGFQNGVWEKGDWREHRREDFLLHLSPVYLDFGADQSEWLAVLDCMTGGDVELSRTLQETAGYILSGASHLRFLPWAYGPKGTGKSTFAELLQTTLGKMAHAIDPKKLQDDSSRERLGADLWNRRLAVCAEAGSQRIEAEILKTLSGGDSLSVRFLYQESFDATPRHVLLMVANDAPRLDAYDDALKDRVVALPFVHPLMERGPLQLTGGARIEEVRKHHDSPLVCGFAVWALEGLERVFQSQSIFIAQCCKDATAQFWADTDPITPFWETIERDELARGIAKSELRARYEAWCNGEGTRPLNRNQWPDACKSYSLEETSVWHQGKSAKGWRLPNQNSSIFGENEPDS